MSPATLAKLINKHVHPVAIYYIPANTPGTTRWPITLHSYDPYIGYRALWMKVIIRAAFDWVSYRDALKLEHKKEAEKAYRWLFEPSDLFNSFESVCHLIDVPADKVRVWVRNLTKEHVAKIEHLERESASPVVLIEAERSLIEEIGDDEDEDI